MIVEKYPKKVPKLIKFLVDAGYNMGSNLAYADKIEILDFYISMNDRSKDKSNLYSNKKEGVQKVEIYKNLSYLACRNI